MFVGVKKESFCGCRGLDFAVHYCRGLDAMALGLDLKVRVGNDGGRCGWDGGWWLYSRGRSVISVVRSFKGFIRCWKVVAGAGSPCSVVSGAAAASVST